MSEAAAAPVDAAPSTPETPAAPAAGSEQATPPPSGSSAPSPGSAPAAEGSTTGEKALEAWYRTTGREPQKPAVPTAPPAETPAANGTPPAEAPPPRPDTIRVRVDGQDMDVPFDDVVAGYQKGRGAEKRFDEAAARMRELDQREHRLTQVVQDLEKNPLGALERLFGPEIFRSDAMKRKVHEALRYERMDPAQRQEIDQRRQLEQRALRGEQLEKQHRDRLQQDQQRQLAVDAASALSAVGIDNPHQADGMLWVAMMHQPGATAQTATDHVMGYRRQVVGEALGQLGQMDGATLIRALGPEMSRKISAAVAAQVASTQQNPTPAPAERQRDEKGRFTPAESADRPKTPREFQLERQRRRRNR